MKYPPDISPEAPSGPQPVIAVAGRKGGQAKTTTAASVAACLAIAMDAVLPAGDERDVVMMDADSQRGALTEWMPPQWEHVAPERRYTMRHVLCEGVPLDDAIWPTTVPRLRIVPGGPESAQFEQMTFPGQDFALRSAVEESTGPHLAMLIDCGPSLTKLPISAMAAANRLVMPVRIGHLDLIGAGELYEMVRLLQKKLVPALTVAAVVLTAVLRSALRDQMAASLARGFPDAPLVQIRHTVRAGEAPAQHEPLPVYDPGCTATLDYWRLTQVLYPEVLGAAR